MTEGRSAKRLDAGRSARRPEHHGSLWARRRLLLVGAALVVVVGAALLALPAVGSWYVRARVVPLIGRRLDRRVTIDRVRVSYRELVLEGVELSSPGDPAGRPMASVARVRVDYMLGPLLRGRLSARRVIVERAVVQLVRHADGASNFLDLLSRRRLGGGSGRLRVGELHLVSGRFSARDERLGLEVSAANASGKLRSGDTSAITLGGVTVSSTRFGNRLTVAELQLSLRYVGGRLVELPRVRVGGGRIRLLPRLELSGIRGSIYPERDRVEIHLDGSYGGSEAKLWSAAGWIDPLARIGTLRINAARFSLGRIASILGRTPVILPQRTQIDGALELSFAENRLNFSGNLQVNDLNLFHPALARTPVLGLVGAAKLKGRLELDDDRLVVQQLDLSSKQLEVKVTGVAERLSARPHIAVRLEVPAVPCQAVLQSFPPSLLPQLQGFELKGKFAVDLHSDVDYAHLDKVELGGSVGIRNCRVVTAPEEMDAARLKTAFEHEVEPAPGQTVTFTVGPDNSDFVPYADIPKNMINAVLTTEDGGFFRHRGFIPSQFRTALARNLQQGGFRLGASTITMQLVKNVLLSHEKTLSRKLQELFLTWTIEQQLSKERMMEIYLNVIEFGPGIYGIGAAARHYFGKAAKDLSPLEAAFFASLLPSPKRRYIQYCRGELTQQWDRYVRRLLRRMAENGYVDEAAQQAAEGEKITFARDTEALTVEDCQKELKELLDSWQEEERRRLKEAIMRSAPHQLDMYVKEPAADK